MNEGEWGKFKLNLIIHNSSKSMNYFISSKESQSELSPGGSKFPNQSLLISLSPNLYSEFDPAPAILQSFWKYEIVYFPKPSSYSILWIVFHCNSNLGSERRALSCLHIPWCQPARAQLHPYIRNTLPPIVLKMYEIKASKKKKIVY